MTTERVAERFAFSGGKVRREGKYPVIEGVLLCGAESKWRRRYKPEAFAGERVKRYEGRPVYLDHDDLNKPRPTGRRYRDKLGWVENARHREDGMPVGDIGINPKHPEAESVLWAAEHRPDFWGMSHVADISTAPAADGWKDVLDVAAVESVDVVATGATTRGAFEGGGPVDVTVAEVVEWVCRHPKATTEQIERVKRVAEVDGVGTLPMDPPSEGVDPDQAIDDAFRTAMHAQIDAMLGGSATVDDLVKKVRALARAHGKVKSAGGDGDGGEKPKESAPPTAAEQLAPIAALCREVGYDRPTFEELAELAELPAGKARRVVAESYKSRAEAAKPEKVSVTGRMAAADLPDLRAAGGGSASESVPLDDPAKFKAWVTEGVN